MDERTFANRTKQFCLKVTRLMGNLPSAGAADVMARQLLPYANSIGANYRAACQGQSSADVLAKLAIVEEQTDEAPYWLEMLVDSHILAGDRVAVLVKEANELLAMTVASRKDLCESEGNQSKFQNPESFSALPI